MIPITSRGFDISQYLLDETTIIQRAQDKLDLAQAGALRFYRTRWENVNRMIDGAFLSPQLITIGSMSGAGKSLIMAMLREDLSNWQLNGKFAEETVFLHFGLDMALELEIFRSIQRETKRSINQMLNVNGDMTPLDFAQLQAVLSTMRQRTHKVTYVEEAVTSDLMSQLVTLFVARHPGKQVVVSFDHTLLATPKRGQDENALVADLSRTALHLTKKHGLLFFLLAQLNDKIEQDARIEKKHLHAPRKTDFFGSKHLFHDVDIAWVIHRPELLGIEAYWKDEIPTADLVAIHQLKYRNFKPGYTYLRAQLQDGQFVPWATLPRKNSSNAPVALKFR